MIITRSQFTDIFNPEIFKIFHDFIKDHPEQYPLVYTVTKSSKRREIGSTMTGMGIAQEKDEGANVDTDRPYEGYDYTATHKTYGLGATITMEMMQDELFREMRKIPKLLARSMKERREVDAANVFNNAFTSGTYGDGVYLCSASHPSPYDGSVRSNVLATPADLSDTSLKTAITMMEKMTDDRGIYTAQKAAKLLVPPDLKHAAKTILESSQVAGSANNDKNVIEDIGLIVMTRLTDTDAWFVLADDREDLIFWDRMAPDIEEDMLIQSRDVHYNSVGRHSIGIYGWRWLVGTPGA